jgi:solute carrier family 25 folate transporter 32
VTVPIFYSLYFPIYEHSKEMYSKLFYGDSKKFNSVVYTFSSVTAALICDFITNPMWVVRIRYQTEFIISGKQKMDSFNVLKSIIKLYKKEGIFALYRGMIASLLGIPHVIIQFNLYEHLKQYGAEKYNKSVNNLPLHYILGISVISKSKITKKVTIFIYQYLVIASFCTYPHEVIRNNLQNVRNYEQKKMTLSKLLKEIHTERGISGFYAGFRINLLRILPNTAIMFMAYEYFSKIMNSALNKFKNKNL